MIELLLVVLIIAILGAIALPQYMVARDKAHLVGLMTIGGNVTDALDRVSLYDSVEIDDAGALDKLDISFKQSEVDGGGDCTGGTCRITVSGKDYKLSTRLNLSGTQGNNVARFYSYTNPTFGLLYVVTDTYNASYNYKLWCVYTWSPREVVLDSDRCFKMARSLGATCNSTYCLFN